MNRLVAALLRSPLHFFASKMLMLVSWSGRQSGRQYSIPVGYQPDGDDVIVMLSKPVEKSWWKNFRSPWPADLQIRGKRHTAMGQVIEAGTPDFYTQCEQTLTRLPWMGSQFGGIHYDPDAGLDDEQRAILCAHVGAVRFEIVDGSSPC
jgi:hypothetical protein